MVQHGDVYIYVMNNEGKMIRTANVVRNRNNPNFFITCSYGDWSGFRTLADCEKQFPELEGYFRMSAGARTYSVVER